MQSIRNALWSTSMTVAIVIPARGASTRLPQKMLLASTGKPLIQHTYERAIQSRKASRVIIATDDEAIFQAAQTFGAEVVMTSSHHNTGTDRLGEVVQRYLTDISLVINVQGDEPEINPCHIDTLIELFEATEPHMGTLVTPFRIAQGSGSPSDPHCCKALLGNPVTRPNGQLLGYRALYFSRSLVPYPRESHGNVIHPEHYYLHLGIYSYRPDFLRHYLTLSPGKLEQIEKLEQLRLLEYGYDIIAGVVAESFPGIDTLDDYAAFVNRYTNTTCMASV